MARRGKKSSAAYPSTVKTAVSGRNSGLGYANDEKSYYLAGKKVEREKITDMLAVLFGRIGPAVCEHQNLVMRYKNILYNLAAATDNKGTQREKEVAYAKGQTDIVSDLRYPKTLGHVNAVAVSTMNVLFPARQMYGSVEVNPDEQKETAAFVQVMNVHAKQFKHYTAYYRIIHDAVAYNLGINEVVWKQVKGVKGKLRPNPQDVSSTTMSQVIKEGTQIRHLDIFNTVLDTSADTESYAMDAEFYATVDMYTEFDLVRMGERGEVILTKELRDALRGFTVKDGKSELGKNKNAFYNGKNGKMFNVAAGAVTGLYTHRPDFRSRLLDTARNEKVDCHDSFDVNEYMNGTSSTLSEKPNAGNELLTVTMRIDPEDFGLPRGTGSGDAKGLLEIWRFKVLNGNHIVYAQPVALSHGLLPCNVTRPKTELSKTLSLSIAELLMPFQEASSSLMNLFIKQARSDANKGVTYHDKRIELNQMADPTSGHIAVDMDGLPEKSSLGNLIYNVQGAAPNNSPIVADQHMESRMQDVFPVDSIGALANLNRPVTHQSRSVSQQQNLPVFVLARIIHEELVEPSSYMQTQDIINFQQAIKVFDGSGSIQTIDPSVFANTELDIAVSDGLRGIDTIAIADRLQALIQFAFQSRRVQQEIDVVAMTAYLLQMEGAQVNLEAFKYKTPFDALGEEEKNLAYQLLQQALAEQQAQEEGGAVNPPAG